VKSSPISIRTFLWIKFFVYFVPLLFLSELLVIVTNLLLHVTPFMMFVSVATVLFMVPGIVSMGIGLGAVYPDFHSENPTQSVTSLGGLIYMTVSIGFTCAVVALEAGPIYSIFKSGIRGVSNSSLQWVWFVGSFAVVFGLSFLALWMPLRWGEKRLYENEFGRGGSTGSAEPFM
jgi:ABC-2 type transport system permease protein